MHSNVRFEFGPLKHLFVTPRFHHWHHTAKAPLDRNFAVHLPVIDRIFGTHHLPERAWPESYGIEGSPVPERFVAHLVYPFRSRRRRRSSPEA